MSILLAKIVMLITMGIFALLFGLLPTKIYKYVKVQQIIKSSKEKLAIRFLSILSCFSGGVFLGVCLLDLLPTAKDRNGQQNENNDNQMKKKQINVSAEELDISIKDNYVKSLSLVAAIAVHSCLEGFTFGIQYTMFSVTTLFLGIIVHKSLIAFSIGMNLIKAHPNKIYFVILLIIFVALMSPVGGLIGIALKDAKIDEQSQNAVTAIASSLANGTFIYITFFEILFPEQRCTERKMEQWLSTTVGFCLIGQSEMMPIGDDRPVKSRTAKRLAGYINRIEQRTIGGPCKRRYWFVLSDDSPYLYWYKNKGDISCTGRAALSGAAFTFDPRETGRFEIHVNNEIHVLETADNKSRVQWLQQLQSNRRRHYEKENIDNILKVEIVSLSSHSLSENDEYAGSSSNAEIKEQDDDMMVIAGPPDEKSLEDEINDSVSQTFAFQRKDAIFDRLQMPILIPPSTDVLRNAEELIEKITEETQAKAKILEQPAKRVIGKAKATLRISSSLRPPCEHCKILLGVVNELKDRCYELTDEVGANQDLVTVLRQSLLKSNRQIELIKRMEEQKNPQSRISMILEKESELTALQLNAASYIREIRILKEQNKQYEQKIEELNTEIDAFRESVRSKEELIMKIYGEQEENDVSDVPFDDVDVPEGILVDFGNSPTDENAQRVFDEAAVNDVTEMRDLVIGYRNQNMFLNQEVLELQKIVQSLEDRERRITRQNFDIEACYYQLKSRYIMVLNHFRASKTDSRVLEPGVIEALIDETNWTANKRTLNNDKVETRLTDSLGFYLNDDRKRHQIQPTDMFEVAAELKNISDKIEQNPQYIDWLQKWDSFLVNFAVRPLKPTAELKNLVRTGVPKTYRPRVWKSGDEKADLGNGYYETLLRKVNTASANTIENDSALKQVFDEPTSEKIVVLRRVLCAYRFHNKSVGYCQGLNRLAAIALLFLEESDAFWFLVACIEHLQPTAYYTSTLLCAVADQKVLRDLVSEKLPKLSSHLRKFEVDLSAFTLSWFLTCFVDVFPHTIYLNLFDVFLYEGNKVLFRFALGVLKLAEASVLECKSVGAVHASLSRIAQYVPNFKTLAQIAFNDLNPFPQKGIEMKRQFYLSQLTVSLAIKWHAADDFHKKLLEKQVASLCSCID
ncbi:TBC1 domain family member 2B [Dirofilaria immitis]|nr:TBC1 domain family member 2B [Dirofilaria immitis]